MKELLKNVGVIDTRPKYFFQGVNITPSGGATKKKHGRTLQAQTLLRENSLQKQLSSNLIFQRQQQRLSAALVDDHNEVQIRIRIRHADGLAKVNYTHIFLCQKKLCWENSVS